MRSPLSYYRDWKICRSGSTSLAHKVGRFNVEKMGKHLPCSPVAPTQDQIIDMMPRIYEEYRELSKALMSGDLEGIADGAGDTETRCGYLVAA